MNRKEILEKLSQYKFTPGHGPDYKKMTDEQLLEQLHFFERLFEDYFNEKES